MRERGDWWLRTADVEESLSSSHGAELRGRFLVISPRTQMQAPITVSRYVDTRGPPARPASGPPQPAFLETTNCLL